MNIVVCIKQVPNPVDPVRPETFAERRTGTSPSAPMSPDRATSNSDGGDAGVVNPCDESALGLALQLREQVKGREVTAITLGPGRAEEALRHCLALGADHAVHLCDPALEGADAYATAVALAAAIRPQKADLVICGERSSDGQTGQVGPCLAELLNLPLLLGVNWAQLAADRRRLLARRQLAAEVQVVECELPALLVVQREVAAPRYPSLPDRLRARRREVTRLSAATLGLRAEACGLAGSPTRVERLSLPKPRTRLFSVDPHLPAAERIRRLLAGGITPRGKQPPLEAPAAEAAEQAVAFFGQRGCLVATGQAEG